MKVNPNEVELTPCPDCGDQQVPIQWCERCGISQHPDYKRLQAEVKRVVLLCADYLDSSVTFKGEADQAAARIAELENEASYLSKSLAATIQGVKERDATIERLEASLRGVKRRLELGSSRQGTFQIIDAALNPKEASDG